MVELKVIRPSNENTYNHVHLVKKPNNSWRFCIDYRRLNRLITAMGWKVPNIRLMFQRIGEARPQYFAKFDLTSGYHQAPMHPNSIKHTAFFTFMGIYEWLRVPGDAGN
jgi:hypothetical protein